MPRIRKKTSKRGTLHQRGKIQAKASETRKKRKRAANKNPQWKSKLTKDPGIPNNFPYKDQVLAEIAEERRQQIVQKANKKKAVQQPPAEDEGIEELSSALFLTSTQNGIVTAGPSTSKTTDEADAATQADISTLDAAIALADIIVEVLDARDPLSYRNLHLEKVVEQKERKLVVLLNKIDLCPKESVQAWLHELRQDASVVPFHSASAFIPSENSAPPVKKPAFNDAVGVDELLSILKKHAEDKPTEQSLTVLFVGLTNVGKSSVVNSLIQRSAIPIYKAAPKHEGPSTTTYPLEVSFEHDGHNIRLIDSPGLMYLVDADASPADGVYDPRVRDILLRNRGRIDKLKDPLPVVADIVSRCTREDLMLFYNTPAFVNGDVSAFLAGVARHHQFIKNDGVPDTAAACRIVLKDWNACKFPYFTLPDAKSNVTANVASHDEILATLRSRKEWRKSPGLLKIRAGTSETRLLDLTALWEKVESEEDGEDEDVDEDVAEGEDDEEEEEEEEEEDELDSDEDMVPEPPKPAGKRKRVQEVAARPQKKVSFAAPPRKTTKPAASSSKRASKRARK
ncbi:hypothetical protein EUX98_g1840 [Antrodiella citrinella]|uniref:CP-type G domain-containing protein n=1 Tax=Antrodiella citrinella TaxID=2447956 RepID=A0A4S4N3A3_9APHY|nr:hypothetical protein EUX98_g1840 [Antrodiella citrinella]